MSVRDEVVRNFSRCAAHYDSYSTVQNQVGLKLIDFGNGKKYESILDVGCGTGNFTQLLRNKFPTAAIKAIDVCGKMIDIAKRKLSDPGTEFVIADAETITLTEKFNLIASNACFQWLHNIEHTIARYKDRLAKGGVMLFSMFGPKTFRELSESLRRIYEPGLQISANTFINADELRALLVSHFDVVWVEEQTFKKTYSSLQELLRAIKYTGTSGTGLNGKVLNRTQIRRLEEVYNQKFHTIYATYEVFYCQAVKKS